MKHLTRKAIYGLIACFLLASAFRASATHMTGGEFTYQLIDSTSTTYHYRVTLTTYIDCEHGQPESIAQDNPAFFAVYSGSGTVVTVDTGIYYTSSVSIPPVSSCGSCSRTADSACILTSVFTKDY